jgi:hypothetical protein
MRLRNVLVIHHLAKNKIETLQVWNVIGNEAWNLEPTGTVWKLEQPGGHSLKAHSGQTNTEGDLNHPLYVNPPQNGR